jgi:hypothetical protein
VSFPRPSLLDKQLSQNFLQLKSKQVFDWSKGQCSKIFNA